MVGKKCDRMSIVSVQYHILMQKRGIVMIIIKQKSAKEAPPKRENALVNSRYSIVRDKKETKNALEKSQRSLAVKR